MPYLLLERRDDLAVVRPVRRQGDDVERALLLGRGDQRVHAPEGRGVRGRRGRGTTARGAGAARLGRRVPARGEREAGEQRHAAGARAGEAGASRGGGGPVAAAYGHGCSSSGRRPVRAARGEVAQPCDRISRISTRQGNVRATGRRPAPGQARAAAAVRAAGRGTPCRTARSARSCAGSCRRTSCWRTTPRSPSSTPTPAARGHVLVVPRAHATDLWEVDPDSAAGVMRTAHAVAALLRDRLHPDGLTLRQNNGAASGQRVDHLHVHLVPRWHGDGTVGWPWPPPQDLDLDAVLADLTGVGSRAWTGTARGRCWQASRRARWRRTRRSTRSRWRRTTTSGTAGSTSAGRCGPGDPEVVYGAGKTPQQVLDVVAALRAAAPGGARHPGGARRPSRRCAAHPRRRWSRAAVAVGPLPRAARPVVVVAAGTQRRPGRGRGRADRAGARGGVERVDDVGVAGPAPAARRPAGARPRRLPRRRRRHGGRAAQRRRRAGRHAAGRGARPASATAPRSAASPPCWGCSTAARPGSSWSTSTTASGRACTRPASRGAGRRPA